MILGMGVAVVGLALVWIWLGEGSGQSVSHSVVLIHGLGGSAKTWHMEGVTDFLVETGFCDGGRLPARGGSVPSPEAPATCETPRATVFTFEAADPWASLDEWVPQLEVALDEARKRTGSERVVLVGFSAGGLAARKYLLAHPEDHRVARLVTVSTPHGGSELASVAIALRKQGVERAGEIPLDSPLLDQLVPPEAGGAFLRELNAQPHPRDVEYALVLGRGADRNDGFRQWQRDVARLRGGDLDSSTLQRLFNAAMGLLSWGKANYSQAGDGAVLLAAQHLARVEFFREHPELIREVHVVPASHFGTKRAYAEILDALEGEPQVLGVEKGGAGYRLLLRDHLAGLCSLEVATPDGRAVAVSPPRLIRRDGEILAELEIARPPEPLPPHLEVRIHQPAGGRPFATRLLLGDTAAAAPVAAHRRVLRPLKVWDLANAGADLLGRADLQLVLFDGEREVWRGPVLQDAPGLVELDATAILDIPGADSRFTLELWDLDLGFVPQVLGRVVWNPGRMPYGRFVGKAGNGLAVEMEVLPADAGAAIPLPAVALAR